MPAFTLRRDFFDAGAELWQCVTKGQCIVGDIDAYVQEPETYAYMQIEHLQTHNAYQQAAVKLASLKAIWEVEANHLSIEPCPSVHVDNHPFFPFFQLCDDVNDGFRMLDGFKSFELDAIRMAETFSLPEPQKVDPEDLALTPTTKTKMCLGGNSPESLALIPKADTKMSLDDQSSLLAEIQGLKDRVAVLEFEKLQANTASLNNGFNIQTFTPETTPERVILARPMPGDIVDRHLEYFPEEMDTSIDWNGGSMSSLTVSTPTSPKGTKEPRLSLAQPDQELLSQLDRVIVMDPEHVKFLDGEVNEQYLGALDATWTAGC
ncbi:Fc.00g044410.m01.CDS01 [Cosmosporella sp. VM-42]